MIKIFAAAAMLGFAMIGPAYAEMICDGPNMDKLKAKIEATTDQGKKNAAMKEFNMAMEMMKAKKTKECLQHMSSSEHAL